jgi:hypothetical protein
MTPPVWQGINTKTPDRLELDSGALYRDYGLSTQDLIGATRGGAVFTVEKEDREIEVDGGGRGPIKNMVRNIRFVARLEATLLEMSLQTFIDAVRGTVVSDGTHFTITPGIAIAAGDFYTNISLVAEMKGATDPMILMLNDAMHVGEWSVTTEDQNEGVLPVRYVAHYDPTDLSIVPFVVKVPIQVS